MTADTESSPTLKARFAHEMKSYFMISVYLFVCFSVILIYGASQSASNEISLLTIGAAAFKALVMGKFILIGEALKPGTRVSANTLLHRVAWRTLALMVVLVIFKLLEELLIGVAHDQSIGAILAELMEKSWLALTGPILLMLLILIPLIIAIELDRVLESGGGLKGLLLQPD